LRGRAGSSLNLLEMFEDVPLSAWAAALPTMTMLQIHVRVLRVSSLTCV
jgi:hypothetical protein